MEGSQSAQIQPSLSHVLIVASLDTLKQGCMIM